MLLNGFRTIGLVIIILAEIHSSYECDDYVAVVASNQVHRFPASARQLGRASMGVSIVGIVLPVVGVVLFIVIVLILTTTSHPVQVGRINPIIHSGKVRPVS